MTCRTAAVKLLELLSFRTRCWDAMGWFLTRLGLFCSRFCRASWEGFAADSVGNRSVSHLVPLQRASMISSMPPAQRETRFIFKDNICMKLLMIYLFMYSYVVVIYDHLCIFPFINRSSCLFRLFIHLLIHLSIQLFIYLMQ